MFGMSGKKFVLTLAAVFAFGVAVQAGDVLTPNGQKLDEALGGPSIPARTLNAMTGELYADIMGTTMMAQRMFRDALPSIADYCQSAHLVSNSYCGPDAKWVMWDTPFLSREARKRNDGYLGYKQTVSGFATGISRMLGETTAVGLAVGYDARKLTGRDDYHWRNKTDTFHAALYGGTALGCFFLDGYAGYSRAWERSERGIDGGILGKGNYNDTVLSTGLKLSYVWIMPNDMRITPSIGLDYSHVSLDGFNESGPISSSMRVDDSSYDSLQMPIMVAVNKTFSSDFLTFGGKCSMWTPEVRAGYVPQFGAKRAMIKYADHNGALPGWVEANSTKLGGSYGTVGAGLKIKLRDKYIFAIDYDYTFAGKYQRHTVTGTYGVSF